MEVLKIKESTNKGLKWIFILTSISIPIQLLLSIILGRFSPQLLGQYGVLELFLNFILTFFLFGGETVLIRFIPDIKSNKDKLSFVVTYTIIVSALYFLFVVLFFHFEISIDFILGGTLPSEHSGALFILGLFYLIYFVVTSSLKGLLRLKASAILQRLPILLSLIYFAFMIYIVKFKREWTMVVFGSFIIISVVLFASIVYFLKQTSHSRTSFSEINILIPNGFWKYSLFIHLSTITIFMYEKIDQVIILRNFDLKVLGIYFACFKVAQFIRFMPKVINQALLPAFSAFLSNDSKGDLLQYYTNSIRYNTFFASVFSISTILMSKEILSVYGSEYVDYGWLLVGFSIIFIAGIPGQVNSNLINIYGKSNYFFLMSISTTFVQFLILFFSIDRLGLIGIVVAKFAAVTIGQIISYCILRNIQNGFKMPRQYLLSATVVLLSSLFLTQSVVVRGIVLTFCILFLGLVNKDILVIVANKLRRKKVKE